MALRLCVIVPSLVALSLGAGCTLIDSHPNHRSRLAQTTPAPDSVTLEVFVAGSSGDKRLCDELWNEIDEQKFPTELRRELAQNGFRVGIVGSHVPTELARLLKLTDEQVPQDKPTEVTAEEPTVTLNVFQTRPGHLVQISPLHHVYEQLPLLVRENGQLHGQPYDKAECRLTLRPYPEKDGTVRLELVPELAYGDERKRFAGSEGVMRFETTKPTKVFEQLALNASLAPGEMLIMSSLPDRAGSIGHYFFNQPDADRPTRKLLVIRVAQAPADAQFDDEPIKTLDLNIE